MRVLVVAATERELGLSGAWRSLVCGVGPVEAAAATSATLARETFDLLLHVGIAGARRAAGLAPPRLIVGTESVYSDLGVPEAMAPHRIVTPVPLVRAAQRALPDAEARIIGTSGRVGRSHHCEVEAMEGFAVLRAAALAGVPAIEVRAIANAIEEPDRARWRFDEAFAAIVAATPVLVAELSRG
ncbi:MAG: hypothetical protein FJ206_11065 [Gemmatimonadetes bacterium]|nr:hypothetical protein [Gemmatimonadota bacterium]